MWETTPVGLAVGFESLNTDVATVDSSGRITAVAVGTATVRVFLAADSQVSYPISFTVTAPTLDGFTFINNRTQLLDAFSTGLNADGRFALTSDIDLDGWTGGILFPYVFTGILDGQGYEIFNFSADSFVMGLGTGGIVRNIKITVNHTGAAHIGLFGRPGQMFVGTIENTIIDTVFPSNPNMSAIGMNPGTGAVIRDTLIIMRGSPTGGAHPLFVQGPPGGQSAATIQRVFVVNLTDHAAHMGNGGTLATEAVARLPEFATTTGWDTGIWDFTIDGEFPELRNAGNISPPRVILSHTSAQTLREGDMLQLTASVMPTRTPDRTVTWSIVGDSGVVTVVNGLVTAVAPGTVYVRATSNHLNTRFAEIEITVPEASDIPAIVLSTRGRHLNNVAGANFTLGVTTRSGGAATFESSDTGVVTVNASGVVTRADTANLGDRATITVTYDGETAECFIYIFDLAGRRQIATAAEFLATGAVTTNILVQDIDFEGIPRAAMTIHNTTIIDGQGYALKNIVVAANTAHFISAMHPPGGTTIRNLSFLNAVIQQGTQNYRSIIGTMHPGTTLENVFFDIRMENRSNFSGAIGTMHGDATVRNSIFATQLIGDAGPATGQVAGIRLGSGTNNFVDTTAWGRTADLGVGSAGRTEAQLREAGTFDATWSGWHIVDGEYPVVFNSAFHG